MTLHVPVRVIAALRGVHQEETETDAPLSSDLVLGMMAAQAALFEHLSDEPVSGNDTRTNAGHSHGRDAHDGVYVARHGSFDVGHIPLQETTDQQFVPIHWDIFNTGGPNAGQEQPGNSVTLVTPALFVHQAYKALVLRVLLRCENGGGAEARLSLWHNGLLLAAVTESSTDTSWETVTLTLPIENNASFTGWRQLSLELRCLSANDRAGIASDDDMFKPPSGQVMNGRGLFVGEPS